MRFWRKQSSSVLSRRRSPDAADADYFLDDGEPLSHEEEITLDHASHYPSHFGESSYSYTFNNKAHPTGKSGSFTTTTSSATGALSIESVMRHNSDMTMGSTNESPRCLNPDGSKSSTSISTRRGSQTLRRLSNRLSFFSSTDSMRKRSPESTEEAVKTSSNNSETTSRPTMPHIDTSIGSLYSNGQSSFHGQSTNTGSSDVNKSKTKTNTPAMTLSSMSSPSASSSGEPLTDHRDFSLSPTVPAEGCASPVSSLIFERSVQEFGSPTDRKIPAHYHNEDYIPPVLEASANAITDNSADLESIEVISARHRAKACGSPDNAEYNAVFSIPSPDSHSTRKMRMSPNNCETAVSPSRSGNNGFESLSYKRRSISGSDRNQHILTFYSYADVVNSEGSDRSNSFVTSDMPGERSPMDENASDDFVDVQSMGQMIRKNTGEIAAHHA